MNSRNTLSWQTLIVGIMFFVCNAFKYNNYVLSMIATVLMIAGVLLGKSHDTKIVTGNWWDDVHTMD